MIHQSERKNNPLQQRDLLLAYSDRRLASIKIREKKQRAQRENLLAYSDRPLDSIGLEAAIFDPREGQRYFLAEAGRRLGELLGGKPLPPPTLGRWIHKGMSGVPLEAHRLGGRWVVSEAALGRFVAAITRARVVASAPAPHGGTDQRRIERVGQELDALGI
jgi:hypothetical protein